MTLEGLPGEHRTAGRMEQAGDALEEVLSKALSQRSLTLGVYEAAKLLNVDPDNVVLCLLAADEEEAEDAALQIHFTLIQAFCCENDINILRVSNPARLAQLLLPHTCHRAPHRPPLRPGHEPPRVPVEGPGAESAHVLLPGAALRRPVGAGHQPPRAVTAPCRGRWDAFRALALSSGRKKSPLPSCEDAAGVGEGGG
uniref:Growth arrest and DNA damage-inducible protein GADD45 alpha n=1 Tax=Anas platyrhynchos TaxID=8839 RepID=A0A8B9SFP8_ANAPL